MKIRACYWKKTEHFNSFDSYILNITIDNPSNRIQNTVKFNFTEIRHVHEIVLSEKGSNSFE